MSFVTETGDDLTVTITSSWEIDKSAGDTKLMQIQLEGEAGKMDVQLRQVNPDDR